MRPTAAEHLPYFDRYISLVPGDRIVQVLAGQLPELRERLASLPAERAGFRYAPGKWSVREVVGHLIDTERVFGYRALWFARGEDQSLAGFDQEDFAAAAEHDHVPIRELVDEFSAMRESHLLMFSHLPNEAWNRSGSASSHSMSVRAAAFIMAGHVRYHLTLLHERYGV